MLPPDTVAVFQLASALACDSVVTVTVNSYPTLSLILPMDTTISIGASVLLGDVPPSLLAFGTAGSAVAGLIGGAAGKATAPRSTVTG